MNRLLKYGVLLLLLVVTKSAFAFFEPITWSVIAGAAVSIGAPVGYLLGSATAFSPPVRVFGDEYAVYGLDWGSLACHAGSVYGLQMSFWGGSFEDSLYGLQLGLVASGYAKEKLLGKGDTYGNGYIDIVSVKEAKFPTAGTDSDFFQAKLVVEPVK